MRTEIPVCKRCCFCLPLRYGLIVWGYLRLGIDMLFLVFLGFLWHAVLTKSYYLTRDRVYSSILTLIVISDFVLSLIFVVSCHKKNVKLMKMFYFYSQFLLGLSTAWIIFYIGVLITEFTYRNGESSTEHYVLFNGMDLVAKCLSFFAYLFLQLYMLLIVRSEIIKLNNGCQFRFENHTEEAQCTLEVTTLPTQRLTHEDIDTKAL